MVSLNSTLLKTLQTFLPKWIPFSFVIWGDKLLRKVAREISLSLKRARKHEDAHFLRVSLDGRKTWESTRGVIAGEKRERVDTIRRELALHGRVCKYAALSALRVKARFVMPRPRSSSSRIDARRGPTWKTYGRAATRSMQDASVRGDVPFP